MNKSIEKLYHIAQKPARRIVGLMAGTSLDGLDVALCRISGSGKDTQVVLEHFETIDFTDDVRSEIRLIFAKKTIDFQHLTLLNAWIGRLHGIMVNNCLKKWDIAAHQVDVIASHGQTVFHAPKILHQIEKYPNATLQIGDGDHIAVTTGIITLSDFRQKHVAAGGEGAPLAVYGDYFVFSSRAENRILLNMGGIANFTYLPANDSQIFVTDTGTGNTLIDSFTRFYYPNKNYDKNAVLAKKGHVMPELLRVLKKNAFFDAPVPKTTGPELFSRDYVFNAARTIGFNIDADRLEQCPDILATLTRFSAETIAEAIQKTIPKGEFFKIYMSGGGMHNPLLVKWLQELLINCSFAKTNELGINGDAKEAVLFAILANECLTGGNTHFSSVAGIPNVTMGKISFPH